jgi:hypothetical protein
LTVYRDRLHFPEATVYVLLGGYVLGLIPALLMGMRSTTASRRIVWVGLICGAAATGTLMLGQGSVVITALGRIVAGVSVGIAMSAGVTLVRALRLAKRPTDVRGAVVAGSMTLTAGLAAGAAAAGGLATYGTEPILGPYLLHLSVLAVGGLFLAACRPVRPVETRQRPVVGSVPGAGTWALTAFTAPWVFIAGSVAYGLIPGLVSDISATGLPAFAAITALTTLILGTLIQPWASRLVISGRRPYTVALISVTAGLVLVVGLSVTGSAALGLLATVPLGFGFGVALASGAVRAEAVAASTGRRQVVARFYALTYTGFAAPAVIAALALPAGYPAAVAAVAVAAAAATAFTNAAEPRTQRERS